MALHTQLPIYKVAYDLLQAIVRFVKNMPRDFKQSIGGDLRDECVQMVKLIFRANCAKDKKPHLDALIESQQMVELLLRLSMDLRLISKPQYAQAIEMSTRLGKQANGWRRSAASPDS